MNGFIGQAPSAKFILLACSNDSLLPTKKDMTDFFPNHQMNIYKAWGHFSNNFDDIQLFIKIKQLGVVAHTGFGLGNSHTSISHAIRLNNQSKRNSFFDLKYGGMVIDYLHLTPQSLKDLSLLLNQIREMNARIDSVLGCKSDLESAEKRRLLCNYKIKRFCVLTLRQSTRFLIITATKLVSSLKIVSISGGNRLSGTKDIASIN